MTWTIPAPEEIAERHASGFEQAFLDALGITVDAHAPNAVLGVLSRVPALTLFESYLYQQYLSAELMPDTAVDTLDEHANIWGVPRLQPSQAIGNLLIQAPAGAALPAGIEATDGTNRWRTSAAATVPASGTASVPALAEAAGSAGNLGASTLLTLVSPVFGVAVTAVSADANGFQGGADLEGDDALRARLLARIRDPGAGGKASDYVQWAKDAGAAYATAVASWVGPGTVGVVVAMAGPRAPTPDELARIDAAIQVLRPVTAEVVTVGAALVPVPVTLRLDPDTVATRAGAQAALVSFFAQDAQIGGVLARSRLDAAVSSGSGEFEHHTLSPADDVDPGRAGLPVFGGVTFA